MVSVVMSHFNRLDLLDFTLNTINRSTHTDYEVIVVDDFSDEHNNPEQLKAKNANMNLRVIRMDSVRETKNYRNPCIPYNVGFAAAQGDKIIIQNPECCHLGDVISYTENNLTDDNYLSFHCYASTQNDLTNIYNGKPIQFNNNHALNGGWYNHERFRPLSFHFTTAITRNRLQELNGFDERFAEGIAVDDVEFIDRVKRLIPHIKYVSDPYVIHQYHPKVYTTGTNHAKFNEKNRQLLQHIRKTEPLGIHAHNNGKQIITG